MADKTLEITLKFKDDGSIVVDQAKKKLDDFDKVVKDANTSLSGFQESWTGVTGKIAATTAIFYGAVKTFSSFIKEAAEAEATTKHLELTVERTGYSWNLWKSNIDSWTEATARATHSADDLVKKGLSQMLFYTVDLTKAQKGAQLALDMSRATGNDYETTLRLVGMAMAGFPEMIGRWVPELRNLNVILGDNATEAQKSAYSLKKMQETFGGAASKDLDTFTEKLGDFGRSWSDLKRSIGEEALPPAKDFLETITFIVDKMKQLYDQSKGEEVKVGLIDYFKGIWPFGGKAKAGGVFGIEEGMPGVPKGDVFTADIAAAKKKWEEVRDLTIKAMTEEFATVDAFNEKWIEDERKAQWEIKLSRVEGNIEGFKEIEAAALASNVMTLDLNKKDIEDYKAAIYARVEYAVQGAQEIEAISAAKSKNDYEINQKAIEDLKNREKETAKIMEDVGREVSQIWVSHVSAMLKGTENLAAGVKGIFADMADYVIRQEMKMAANWALFGNMEGKPKAGSGILGSLGSLLGIGGGTAGGVAAASTTSWAEWLTENGLGFYQHGGIIDRPTLGIVGENGPEAVIPLQGGKIPIEGGGGNNTVIMYIEATDVDSFERKYKGSVTKIIHMNKKSGMMRG